MKKIELNFEPNLIEDIKLFIKFIYFYKNEN